MAAGTTYRMPSNFLQPGAARASRIDLSLGDTMTLGRENPFPTALSKEATANPTFMEQYGAEIAVAGIGLQSLAQAWGGMQQVDNIFENIRRTEMNIEQIEAATREAMANQLIKNKRVTGMTRAKIGSSGVGYSGSPLTVMMHNHSAGMRNYDAIYRKGKFAIEDAYRSIQDQLDQAKDVGTGMIVGGISNTARAAFTYGMLA